MSGKETVFQQMDHRTAAVRLLHEVQVYEDHCREAITQVDSYV